MVALVDDILLEGFVSWTLEKFYDEMLSSIRELEEERIEERIDRLIESPYISGKNALTLASRYHQEGDYEKTDLQLGKAIEYFNQAGNQLSDIEQIHSYFLAGVCSQLMKDFIGKKHFFQLALNALNQLGQDKDNSAIKANKAVKSATKIGQDMILGWQNYISFHWAYHILKSTENDYQSYIKGKQRNRKFDEDEELPVFNCTISHLASVLEQNINNDYDYTLLQIQGKNDAISYKLKLILTLSLILVLLITSVILSKFSLII
ncbi:MAG: hypothetical protein AAGD25_12710 [Cyanobacteria bacterium P01_F01_bin.150]